MKKIIFLFAFIVGTLFANAQKFSVKVSVPNRMTQSVINPTFARHLHNAKGQEVSVGGSIEFSKKKPVKFRIEGTQDKPDVYLRPLNKKQLEKAKEVITQTKEREGM